MYAIIETGGKQYRVQEGDVITVEKLPGEAGDKVSLDKVLLMSDGNEVKAGTPYLEGTSVEAQILETAKGKKVIIFKYKAKKDYRKKQGHRQPYTKLEILSLGGKGAAPKKAAKPAEAEDKAPVEEKAEAAPAADTKAESKKISANMKKDELLAYASEHGIEVDPKATKAVIIEAIEAAEK